MTALALSEALLCIQRGWHVFPCRADKAPATPHGFKDATSDPDEVRELWRQHPGPAFGIATGSSGLVVVDIDCKNGAPGYESWQELGRELGPGIEDTAVVGTPSGGRHYYYRANGHKAGSTVGKLAAGIDTRGAGGYVIGPGSPGYDYIDGHGPERLAVLPEALAERLADVADGQRAKRAPETGESAAVPQGQRNAHLASLAGSMRRRGMTGEAIAAALAAENSARCQPPLADAEIRSIADSIAKYEPDAAGPALVHEAAHADALSRAWRGEYRWDQHRGTWRRWDGRVWDAVAEETVVADAQAELRRHYGALLAAPQAASEDKRLKNLHSEACRYSSVAAGLAFLKGMPGFHTAFSEWDAGAYTLNVADGLLDVRTQTLKPHDPDALCTRLAPWGYGDGSTTGAWQRHLERCLPDADVRRQVQRDLGRALVDAVLEESLPIWYGSGANGKSTTQAAIMQGLGGYTKRAVKNLLVASKYERHPTEVADLAGSRVVFSEEVESGKHLDEALVKDLTGGGLKKARFMRCDNFEFEQTFTIFMLVNHRPAISGIDNGIWRRIRLVPWTVTIPHAEQRPQDEMVAELVADGSWMLRWMVAGFADWQRDHHWVAESVKVATDAYRAEQDRLAGFLAEACEVKAHATTPVGELYDAYVAWCEASDEVALSKRPFGASLRDRGFSQKAVGHEKTRCWVEIRLFAGKT